MEKVTKEQKPKCIEDVYDAYLKEQGLPHQCIDELLYLDSLTDLQRGWLECAAAWWEVVECERDRVKS